MITINSRYDTITIPLTNRCHLKKNEKYYLLIQNTYTKDIYILKTYNPFSDNYRYNIQLSLPEHFTYGEYEYYLTPDNLLKVTLDINNVKSIENNAFKSGEFNMIFTRNGVIFAESGDTIIASTECEGEIIKELKIISHGILKFNEKPIYNEHNKETESRYVARS